MRVGANAIRGPCHARTDQGRHLGCGEINTADALIGREILSREHECVRGIDCDASNVSEERVRASGVRKARHARRAPHKDLDVSARVRDPPDDVVCPVCREDERSARGRRHHIVAADTSTRPNPRKDPGSPDAAADKLPDHPCCFVDPPDFAPPILRHKKAIASRILNQPPRFVHLCARPWRVAEDSRTCTARTHQRARRPRRQVNNEDAAHAVVSGV